MFLFVRNVKSLDFGLWQLLPLKNLLLMHRIQHCGSSWLFCIHIVNYNERLGKEQVGGKHPNLIISFKRYVSLGEMVAMNSRGLGIWGLTSTRMFLIVEWLTFSHQLFLPRWTFSTIVFSKTTYSKLKRPLPSLVLTNCPVWFLFFFQMLGENQFSLLHWRWATQLLLSVSMLVTRWLLKE